MACCNFPTPGFEMKEARIAPYSAHFTLIMKCTNCMTWIDLIRAEVEETDEKIKQLSVEMELGKESERGNAMEFRKSKDVQADSE